MNFTRQLENEILDDLDPTTSCAQHARRDLQRINYLMGSVRHLTSALEQIDDVPQRILELGAGDGTLMLRLAKRFSRHWRNIHLTLLDRQNLMSEHTHQAFINLGWTVETLPINVIEWSLRNVSHQWDIAIANLFIHHLDDPSITLLFAALTQRVDHFIACEPRRNYGSLLASRLVGVIGANTVTRKDAVLSVQSGFSGHELSSLWPQPSTQWNLKEHSSGLFSHRFIASRKVG